MAAINDLIAQVENPELRARLEQEVARLNKQKKFGLVFEEHMPECAPLYEMPIRRGSHVALRVQQSIQKIYTVLAINDKSALCFCEGDNERAEFSIADLVVVAQFGEPIYPYLKQMDSVCNAPDSDLWHMEEWKVVCESGQYKNLLGPNSGTLPSRRRRQQSKIRELASYGRYAAACAGVLR